MRHSIRLGSTLLFLCAVLTLSCAATYAWLGNSFSITQSYTASTLVQYFAGGDGSKDKPYLISDARHLYNLAWLQNIGIFDNHTVYFQLMNDVDMSSSSTITGAIPPIGSSGNPFTGYFDGKGYSIKNLHVSSDENDWKEKPVNYNDDIGSAIGLFGAVKMREDGDPTYVGNFSLQNLQVTTDVEGNVGLVAGNVDASMSNIAVINSKIDVKGEIPLHSSFSTIGNINASDVIWTDNPTNEAFGGDLTVQPGNHDSNSPYNIYKAFPEGAAIAAGSSIQLPGSVIVKDQSGIEHETALIKGGASLATPGLGSVFVYEDANLSFTNRTGSNSIGKIKDANLTQVKNSSYTFTPEFKNFYNYYTNAQYTKSIIKFPQVPNVKSGTNVDDLQNCVWFKPQAIGKCALVFMLTNQSNPTYMSVYRFQRDENNLITNVEEMSFFLWANSRKDPSPYTTNIGNHGVIYYELNLHEEDLAYEYVIGRSTNDTNPDAGFYYMMLAGTKIGGDSPMTGTGKVLEKIDFLPSPAPVGSEALADALSSVHNSVLEINGTTSDGQNFLYSAQSDGKVHYYTNGNPILNEVFPNDPQSVQDSTLAP